MKHILEVTACYKMGHQTLVVPVAIIARNINRIEKMPEEMPEFAEGINTRIQLPLGDWIPYGDKYEHVIDRWHTCLEHQL